MVRHPKPAAAAKPSTGYIKERVKGPTVEPDYVLRLMGHIGPTAAAELIGVSPATLHKARAGNIVSPPIEAAARGIWLERGFVEGEDSDAAREKAGTSIVARTSRLSRPPDRVQASPGLRTTDMHEAVVSAQDANTVLYLIQVAKDRAAILERTAEALGATIISHA